MIKYMDDEILTPKQVALVMVRVAMNSIDIDAELSDYYSMTPNERKLVKEQFSKVYGRIEKRYLAKGIRKIKRI